jgi:hypothetical protein
MHISMNYKGKLEVNYDRSRSESEHLHILLQEMERLNRTHQLRKKHQVNPACIVSKPMAA